MRKLLAAGVVAGFVLLGGGIVPASAAPPAGQICPALSSGKIDVGKGIKSITIQAPPGKKISQICVKAGSAQQNLGAKFINYNPAKLSVTFKHPSGKDISHYSVRYVNGGSGGYNG